MEKDSEINQAVIADNWSLQDITSLLNNGLVEDSYDQISIVNGDHIYQPVPSSVIQSEALFDFLTDLVLGDRIIVDAAFTDTWEDADNPISLAAEYGLVTSFPFLNAEEKIAGPRERIVEHLCATQSLKEAQARNEESYRDTGVSADGLLAATLWGGAGMCARSFAYEKNYTPHPLRKRLFKNTGFMRPSQNAASCVEGFLVDEKVKVMKRVLGQDYLSSALINIPSIPLRIIQEANSPDQFISIALEFRKEFDTLRAWLNDFQRAMGEGDTKALLKYRKVLDSVSDNVDRKIGLGAKNNPVSMELSLGIFKLNLEGNPIELLKNQFGVRAQLNKLVFYGSGKKELDRYLKMFDAKGTSVAFAIEQELTKTV